MEGTLETNVICPGGGVRWMLRSLMGIAPNSLLLAVAVATVCGCSQAHAVSRIEATRESTGASTSELTDAAVLVPGEREASAPVEPKPAWTTTTTLADPPVDLPKGVAGVTELSGRGSRSGASLVVALVAERARGGRP